MILVKGVIFPKGAESARQKDMGLFLICIFTELCIPICEHKCKKFPGSLLGMKKKTNCCLTLIYLELFQIWPLMLAH